MDKMICWNCNSDSDMKYIDSVGTQYTIQLNRRVCFVQCDQCGQISLFDETDDGNIDKYYMRIYPIDKSDNDRIPKNLRRSFDEAVNCMKAKLYLACVVMSRRCLDIACSYHTTKSNNLKNSIAKLHEKRIIGERLNEWASSIRQGGNQAAHDEEYYPSKTEAEELLCFTGALIHFIYASATAYKNWCLNCGCNVLGIERSTCSVCGEKLELGGFRRK